MKFVSFNIQYGVGLDGICAPERIADAVRGADVIGLQEVSRNLPQNDGVDLPEILTGLLGDYFHAFGAGVDSDAGSSVENGRAVMRRLQFGNMILSRHPILATRNILLPRSRTYGELNIQRSAFEALIDTPSGPLRVYSVHLDHRAPSERIAQIAFLKDRAKLYSVEGGAVTGGGALGFKEMPTTDDYLFMGDFNMLPESPEYISMVGPKDVYYGRTPRADAPTDALDHLGQRKDGDYTWEEPRKTEVRQYLDYVFVSGSLVERLKNGWVDAACIASDHKPVWLEMA